MSNCTIPVNEFIYLFFFFLIDLCRMEMRYTEGGERKERKAWIKDFEIVGCLAV